MLILEVGVQQFLLLKLFIKQFRCPFTVCFRQFHTDQIHHNIPLHPQQRLVILEQQRIDFEDIVHVLIYTELNNQVKCIAGR